MLSFGSGTSFAVASNRWKEKRSYLLMGEMSQMSLWSIRMSPVDLTLALDGRAPGNYSITSVWSKEEDKDFFRQIKHYHGLELNFCVGCTFCFCF